MSHALLKIFRKQIIQKTKRANQNNKNGNKKSQKLNDEEYKFTELNHGSGKTSANTGILFFCKNIKGVV